MDGAGEGRKKGMDGGEVGDCPLQAVFCCWRSGLLYSGLWTETECEETKERRDNIPARAATEIERVAADGQDYMLT